MKLYFFPTPRNLCVTAMIDHLGLDVERVPVNLLEGVHKAPEFVAINPNMKVPALVDGDFHLWEHPAIMLYLAEKAGGDLVPKSARERADLMRWVSWMQMHWAEGADALGMEFLAKPAMGLGDPDQNVVNRAVDHLSTLVPIVETHLGNSRYFLGDTLSVADFIFGGSIAKWQTCKMPLEGAQAVLAWQKRLESLAAWRATFLERDAA